MIIVDGQSILISSQNGPDAAVSKNREAGVVQTYADIATYFPPNFRQ